MPQGPVRRCCEPNDRTNERMKKFFSKLGSKNNPRGPIRGITVVYHKTNFSIFFVAQHKDLWMRVDVPFLQRTCYLQTLTDMRASEDMWQ